MIKPTVGRVVLFYPAMSDASKGRGPLPALIAYVHGDRCINVGAFDQNGNPFGACSVALLQDNDPKPTGYYAEWMEYQKGQAAKTQALEAVAAEKR
jgi:hypothetical protein